MREKLLDAAELMVQERGLNSVSFQHLADAVGLSKPSVFHHFRTKEALAQALIDRCRTAYRDRYDEVIGSDGTAPEKLVGLATIFRESSERQRMCMLGSLSVSAATLPDAAKENLRVAATLTLERFARVFEQGRREGTLSFEGAPNDAALAFLALLQGLQVVTRATRELAGFERAVSSYVQSLSS